MINRIIINMYQKYVRVYSVPEVVFPLIVVINFSLCHLNEVMFFLFVCQSHCSAENLK